ncbi:MAG TPA: DUF418 domain-containing protein [Sphingomicrobium sp.]|nr:DUF418 domain-containing protein [Sphingomicrobium sp.]
MATVPAGQNGQRIVTLDIVRGVAVMGILAMNIVAFAMPEQAYFNPLAYGPQRAVDFVSYAFTFVFVEGKMRGLFSFLFGASMLLVIQLAASKGESAAKATFGRQFWLLLFGMIHFYLIWWGDILIGYALIGMVAWFFRNKAPKSLMRWGIGLIALQFVILAAGAAMLSSLAAAVSAPNPDPQMVETWRAMTEQIAVPSPAMVAADLALHRGPWLGIVENRLTEKLWFPFIFTGAMGAETLGYMLLGMAGLKSGFLTGERDNRRYRKVATTCLAVAIPAYALLAYWLFAADFDVTVVSAVSAATVAFRPLMVFAYAALIILVTRGGGWVVDRIAAAGRAAFTNYLGTSILLTALFYGWGAGLYGSMGRAELYLVVLAMWLVMLAWSKPWLDRFAYGPFEWAWRSLSRLKVQPLRKPRGATSIQAGA